VPPDVLAASVQDVHYEVERYCTWVTQTVPHSNPITRLLAQATFECAVLHLRNLADFLVNDRPMAGPLECDGPRRRPLLRQRLARQAEAVPTVRRPSTGHDADVRRNVQQHLVHLTTARHAARTSGSTGPHGGHRHVACGRPRAGGRGRRRTGRRLSNSAGMTAATPIDERRGRPCPPMVNGALVGLTGALYSSAQHEPGRHHAE
jgi:hypothetical protein